MSYRFTFQLFALLILCLSCNSQKPAVTSNIITTGTEANKNHIVYLFFEIEKTSAGGEIVKHNDTKITEGILKNASLDNRESLPGNIAVTFFGKEGKAVAERIIEDPLHPMMEIYTEEGISKEKVNLPKAEFSIRFNQPGNISSVQLEKISTKSRIHLITIKL